MDTHDTKIVDLVRHTGISRDVINKLLARERSSTVVENAVLIAAFYGETIEEFMRCGGPRDARSLAALSSLLTDDEARMLEAQVRGLLQQRGAE
jgi:plasmid maintenance system antidote protein VapI